VRQATQRSPVMSEPGPRMAQRGQIDVPFNSFSELKKAEGGDICFALDESRPLACFAGIWANWTSDRNFGDRTASPTHGIGIEVSGHLHDGERGRGHAQ
jgi:hypothetical protein